MVDFSVQVVWVNGGTVRGECGMGCEVRQDSRDWTGGRQDKTAGGQLSSVILVLSYRALRGTPGERGVGGCWAEERPHSVGGGCAGARGGRDPLWIGRWEWEMEAGVLEYWR